MIASWLIAFTIGAPVDNPGVYTPGSPTGSALDSHKDAVARFGAAVWNIRRERLLTAAKQLEAAAKQDPTAIAPRRELIRVYSQIGREPDAIRIAKQILARDPEDVDTAHALARLLFDIGELKEAVATAKLAAETPLPIERADKAVSIYRDLATLCEKANDAGAAAVALNKAIELVVEKRKEVLAAAAFTPGEADTIAADCLERLGKVLTKQRKFENAATAFEAAAKLFADPKVNDPSAAARLGWNLSGVYQAKGSPTPALKHLDAFLRLKPIAPEPYARLAALLRDAGRGDEVVPLLRRFVDADAKNLTVKVILAVELAREPATLREADALFTELMAASNDPKIVEVVVRSHHEQSRPGQIIADLDRAFGLLKKDDKKDEKPITALSVAAKAFAAEKVRVIGDLLRADAEASKQVLRCRRGRSPSRDETRLPPLLLPRSTRGTTQ